MSELRFEWDEKKAVTNRRKHGVSFEEARTAFFDEQAIVIPDPDHSDDGADRFVLLGLSAEIRTLVVCHAYRRGATVIRIISARKANRTEQESYTSRGKP